MADDAILSIAKQAVLNADPRDMAKALAQMSEAFKAMGFPPEACAAAEKEILDRINANAATKGASQCT